MPVLKIVKKKLNKFCLRSTTNRFLQTGVSYRYEKLLIAPMRRHSLFYFGLL